MSTTLPPTVSYPAQPKAEGDAQIVAALEEFLELRRRGAAIDRPAFLERHRAVAAELADCLDGLDFVESAARPLLGQELEPAPDGRGEDVIAPATRLGDFRIVRVLGRGGMGVVYEAEQVSLGRPVALKVLPFAASIDPKQRQRFQVEAQAAAHLHHPRIVPVFAVGCDGGVHYFAMQLIEGRTLAEIVRDLREGPEAVRANPDSKLIGPPPSSPGDGGSGTGDGSSLNGSHRRRGFPRAVARLALQVAEALEHAHGLGVIHRDIKPGNLMIDGRGDVWVTDFGLARMLGDATLTISGDLLGTLRYMSPEQAMARRGVVDQRTDIYSLGVTLYELLTLRPAFDGRDRQELLRQIALDEPPNPRRLSPGIPRDLETIVLKAMAKEPASRYQTARELAEDLRRFLDDQPILARRPGPIDRVAKWTRRHRPVVLTGLVVGLIGAVACAGLLGMSYQRFLDHEKRLGRAYEISRLYQTADELIMRAMGEMANNDKDPNGGDFYTFALKRYEEIAAIAAEDGDMNAVLAGAYRRIGFIQMVLRYAKHNPKFMDADAIGSYRKSAELYEAELGKHPDDLKLREDLRRTLSDLSDLLKTLGLWHEVETVATRMMALQRAITSRDPENAQARLSLCWDLTLHATAIDKLGQRDRADAEIREAEAIWRKIAAEHAQDQPLLADIERTGDHIGTTLFLYGREEEGKRILGMAAQVKPDNPSPQVLNNLAWHVVCRPGATIEEARSAIATAKRAVALDPYMWPYLNTLGIAHYRAGEYQEAIEVLERSMQSSKGGDPNDWFPMAMAYWKLDKRAEARKWYDKSVAWMRTDENKHPDLIALSREARELLGDDSVTAEASD